MNTDAILNGFLCQYWDKWSLGIENSSREEKSLGKWVLSHPDLSQHTSKDLWRYVSSVLNTRSSLTRTRRIKTLKASHSSK